MLSFVALSSFLILLRLALFMPFPVGDSINGPDSSARLLEAPQDVDVDLADPLESGEYRLRARYPRNTAELTAAATGRLGADCREERIQAVRDVAWWAVCPNYASFTLAGLARALRDSDPGVKGAAAIGLGSTGGNGAAAVPDLLAARGTTVRHFDHLVDEAVVLIAQSPRWPPASECEDVSTEELERRAAQGVAPDKRSLSQSRCACR
jgi:hypothetical protein